MVGIYKITSPTGKVYIGQSWKIKERKWRYAGLACKRQTKLYSSLISHGWPAHKFEIIHEFPENTTQAELDYYEILYWQNHIDSGFEMLNLKKPGSHGKHSAETVEKMKGGVGSKGHRWGLSEEQKNKHRVAMIGNKNCVGRKLSEETKRKIGLGNKKPRNKK